MCMVLNPKWVTFFSFNRYGQLRCHQVAPASGSIHHLQPNQTSRQHSIPWRLLVWCRLFGLGNLSSSHSWAVRSFARRWLGTYIFTYIYIYAIVCSLDLYSILLLLYMRAHVFQYITCMQLRGIHWTTRWECFQALRSRRPVQPEQG